MESEFPSHLEEPRQKEKARNTTISIFIAIAFSLEDRRFARDLLVSFKVLMIEKDSMIFGHDLHLYAAVYGSLAHIHQQVVNAVSGVITFADVTSQSCQSRKMDS